MILFIGADKTKLLEFFEDISAGYFLSNDDSNERVERCFCLVLQLHRHASCSQRTPCQTMLLPIHGSIQKCSIGNVFSLNCKTAETEN